MQSEYNNSFDIKPSQLSDYRVDYGVIQNAMLKAEAPDINVFSNTNQEPKASLIYK
jgi:hypothetical protein